MPYPLRMRPLTEVPPVRAGRVVAWTFGVWCVLTFGGSALAVAVAAVTTRSGGFGEILGTMLLAAVVTGAVLLLPAIAVAAVVISIRATRARIIQHRLANA